MFLAGWNCFSIPFRVAFEPTEPDWMLALDVITTLIFLVDILINFRTSVINIKTGEEIFDGK